MTKQEHKCSHCGNIGHNKKGCLLKWQNSRNIRSKTRAKGKFKLIK